MSTDQLLIGLGLTLTLAVGSQLLAQRARLPAIVVLLPAGFLAGIATDDIHPDRLLGDLYQPFVSIAVGVILFEAGLRLSLRELEGHRRRSVRRLVGGGVLLTWIGVSAAAWALFGDLGGLLPVLVGAILVVSGPTVVLPLLSFVRPTRSVRTLLTWEGVLVDPIGALLGVLVFHAVLTGGSHGSSWRPGEMLLSVAAGAGVGLIAAGVLWLLLVSTQRTAPRQAVPVVLMMVTAALVGADLLREDAGFVATTLMGAILANQRRIDVSLMLEFHATLVRLLIGVLFVLIAASVTPADIGAVLPAGLVLVAAMAFLIRPVAVALTTLGSGLSLRERAFVAWMAPRGIVAGATASAFGLELQHAGVPGAQHLLPIVFVAIFGTVVLYGLTCAPVAKLLGVAGAGGNVLLVVGGTPSARAVAEAAARAGVRVRVWAGRPGEQSAARAAGIDADAGRLLTDAVSRETELEEVTDAVLMTGSDDFNALAAAELRSELGHDHVFRLAPSGDGTDLLPPAADLAVIAGPGMTAAELERRLSEGARVAELPDPEAADGAVPLFVVTAGRELRIATADRGAHPAPGDRVIGLTRVPAGDDGQR